MLAERKRQMKLLAVCFYPFILYLAIKLAPYKGDSLSEFIEGSSAVISESPLFLRWTQDTLKMILIFTAVYILFFYMFITSMKNVRPDEEYGSAKLESPGVLSSKYRTKLKIGEIPGYIKILRESREAEKSHRLYLENMLLWRRDMIISRNIRMSIETSQQNLNTLILGGSGTGKSRGFIIPNIMQLNSSFICTDPKGEILRKTGKLLKAAGYDIRVLDLKNHQKSHGYNPFIYFRNDDDVLLFVNNMWQSMEDKAATKSDQMWDDLAKTMLMSFVLYIYHYAPVSEQNFDTVMYMYHQIEITEQKTGPTVLDKLYSKIPDSDPAYGYYKDWSIATGRTLSSICSTFSSRMTVFNLDSMKSLTYKDEMGILDLATERVAIFLLLPDDNAVYNFLAGTLYTQTFQQLYDYADNVADGPLPQHVRFYMDEFANIALPNDYQKILSTARSRNMSFAIVLQDKQQIEAIFEKYYRTLYGNCSIYLFLGSGEYETCKYYSDILGDETVVVYNWTRNYGKNSGSSRSESRVGRKILTPDEVRVKGRDKCIVMINGEYGSIDKKMDLKKHPFYEYISDGKNTEINKYEWGIAPLSVGTIEVLPARYGGNLDTLSKGILRWRVISPEEIEEMTDNRRD